MRTATNHDYTHESVDHLIEKNVFEGCQEILLDELSSPVFCGRNVLSGNLPAFTEQGKTLSNKVRNIHVTNARL
jgi:hypothetical protein